jgi:hypothetical protein
MWGKKGSACPVMGHSSPAERGSPACCIVVMDQIISCINRLSFKLLCACAAGRQRGLVQNVHTVLRDKLRDFFFHRVGFAPASRRLRSDPAFLRTISMPQLGGVISRALYRSRMRTGKSLGRRTFIRKRHPAIQPIFGCLQSTPGLGRA